MEVEVRTSSPEWYAKCSVGRDTRDCREWNNRLLFWVPEERPNLVVEFYKSANDKLAGTVVIQELLLDEKAREHSVSGVRDARVSVRGRFRALSAAATAEEQQAYGQPVRMVVTSTELFLVWHSVAPLPLLARICAALQEHWPKPPTFRAAHGARSASFCKLPKAASLQDGHRKPLTAEEKAEVEARDVLLANGCTVITSVLWAQGYRECTRTYWVPSQPPTPIVPSAFTVCFSGASVTAWGAAPITLVGQTLKEIFGSTEAEWKDLPSLDSGQGIKGHLLTLNSNDSKMVAKIVQRLRSRLSRVLAEEKQYHLIETWSPNILLGIRVSDLAMMRSRSRSVFNRFRLSRRLSVSSGSFVEDESPDEVVNDPMVSASMTADISALITDIMLFRWPADFNIASCFNRAGLGDCKVLHTDRSGEAVIQLHTAPEWQSSSWKGNTYCRIMKQCMWLSLMESMCAVGYDAAVPHFQISAVRFRRDETHNPQAKPTRFGFLQLVCDFSCGAVVEVHVLDHEHMMTIMEALKMHGVHHVQMHQQQKVLQIQVSNADVLLKGKTVASTALSEMGGSDKLKNVEKQYKIAESRCFSVLMHVLSVLSNACNMEPVTSTWKSTLDLSIALSRVLGKASDGPLGDMSKSRKSDAATGSMAPVFVSYSAKLGFENLTSEFSKLRWNGVVVQGFCLRELVDAPAHLKTKWVRITTCGKYTDFYGDFSRDECEALVPMLGIDCKVINARDERKHHLCWSISYVNAAETENTSYDSDAWILDEMKTMRVVSLLRDMGWQIGPEPSEKAECIMFRAGTPLHGGGDEADE